MIQMFPFNTSPRWSRANGVFATIWTSLT